MYVRRLILLQILKLQQIEGYYELQAVLNTHFVKTYYTMKLDSNQSIYSEKFVHCL